MSMSEEEKEAIIRQLHAELRARPAGQPLTREELRSFLERMPDLTEGWSSAEYIRELRGPLPEDESEQCDDRR